MEGALGRTTPVAVRSRSVILGVIPQGTQEEGRSGQRWTMAH